MTDANEGNEEIVTLFEVLKREEEMQAEAAAVLGGSDHVNCTYDKGYIKRQALYACRTCELESGAEASKYAGVCLACSYKCHEGHELIELYTKRNFRCDCGTPKFGDTKKCVLTPEKPSNNDLNIYNQNFEGLYCNCHRPYPDPDSAKECDDEMIQCGICEDWFHSSHVGGESNDSQEEMICGDCIKRCEFLLSYLEYSRAQSDKDDSAVEMVDSEKEEEEKEAAAEEEPPVKKMKLDETVSKCKLLAARDPSIEYDNGAVFWPCDWRQHLCKCENCLQLYKTLKVEFLLDEDDTVQKYMEKGREKNAETVQEQEQRLLSSLDRVHQVEFLHGFNNMKDRMVEFLTSFANQDKVVTGEDVKKFFGEMNDERKAKREQNQISSFCR